MCVVSMVMDYLNTSEPLYPNMARPVTFTPLPVPVEGHWDRESLDILKAALALLAKLDAKLGEPDCADPRKAKVLEDIEERVRKLEEAKR